jgi:hypothetical protein
MDISLIISHMISNEVTNYQPVPFLKFSKNQQCFSTIGYLPATLIKTLEEEDIVPVTMRKLGDLVQAPMNCTTFLWRTFLYR